MFHTFATYEDAAIFASAMRSDGYYAEILDSAMGTLYGPRAIGGIRVIVSDGPLENDDESPPPLAEKTDDGELITVLRMLVVSMVPLGLIFLVVHLYNAHAHIPFALVGVLLDVLSLPLLFGLLFAILGPLMGDFSRFVRGESLEEGWDYLRWLLLIMLVPFLLLAVIMRY